MRYQLFAYKTNAGGATANSSIIALAPKLPDYKPFQGTFYVDGTFGAATLDINVYDGQVWQKVQSWTSAATTLYASLTIDALGIQAALSGMDATTSINCTVVSSGAYLIVDSVQKLVAPSLNLSYPS